MINGVKKTSFVDYPKKTCYVIFMGGCNMRCPFCHNSSIVERKTDEIELDEILSDLKERKGFIDAVTITGGEPTLYSDKLIDIIKKIKSLGYLIKLDTNGTNPELLKILIKEKLIDYIAMDIKNTFKKYSETTDSNIDIEKIKESINLIENSNIDYEFRTTINKTMHTEKDIKEILSYVKNNKLILQPYKYSKEQIKDIDFLPFSDEDLEKLKIKFNIEVRI